MTLKGHSPYYDHGGKIPNWLMARKEVSMGAKVAFARLAQYAGKKTVAYPCVGTLAGELGVSRRMTVTYLKELVEHGVLARKSKRGRATCYCLLPHKWQTEWVEERKSGYGAPKAEARKDARGGNNASQVGGNNASQGWEEYFPQKILKEDPQGEDPQGEDNHSFGEMGGATAPPSLSPEPRGATLAPGPGSYSEEATREFPAGADIAKTASVRSAREPDAEHEFDTSNGQTSLEELKARVGRDAAKRAETQLAKEKKRAQAAENLNGNGKSGLTPTQKQALKQVESVWSAEMGKRFPDLAIAAWDAKNRGQARNLVTKYDGRSAIAAVKYVVRGWEEFNEKYFKGTGTLPTIGMILKLHETIVPVAVQWEKHADTMEEWEKFYAEHPYDDPPADLEKKYRAAKASLNALGLA
jgi:hypothetical protein